MKHKIVSNILATPLSRRYTQRRWTYTQMAFWFAALAASVINRSSLSHAFVDELYIAQPPPAEKYLAMKSDIG